MDQRASASARGEQLRGALDGLRVVDLTQGIAGPQCTKHLADAGASVIKLESPRGDVARTWRTLENSWSPTFLALNRGKMSVALDIDDERARAALQRLAGTADVVVCDQPRAVVDERGVGEQILRRLNPRLVYCSVTPFGDIGPYAGMPGSELTIQGMVDYLRCLGRVGGEPVRLGLDVAQMNAGMFALQAILAALLQRSRNGKGQYVTVSWFGALLHVHGLTWAAFTAPDTWGGQHHDLYTDPPRHCYKARDGEIYFTPGRMSDEGWRTLYTALNFAGHLGGDDPRFRTAWRETIGIGLHATELRPVWERVLVGRTRAELVSLLKDLGANAVPVNTLEDIASDPQVAAVEMIVSVAGDAGEYRTTGIPWKLSATPSQVARPAPAIGEHTIEILRSVGYSADDINQMIRSRVAVAP